MTERQIVELYDAHARALIGFFARRTGNPQVALDLLGDTFLAAYAHRRRCRATSEGERAAWLFKIAANTLAGYFRRGASERRANERLAAQLRAPTDQELETIRSLAEAGDRDDILLSALAGLSPVQREAVRLRVLDERPYPEVSACLGVSEPAARARVSRGLRTLRRLIDDEPRSSRGDS